MSVIVEQILAVGKILSVLGMGNPSLWTVILAGVFVFYAALGGQHAVIRTDIIQAGIIFIVNLAGLA